jgi:hypothetical protein
MRVKLEIDFRFFNSQQQWNNLKPSVVIITSKLDTTNDSGHHQKLPREPPTSPLRADQRWCFSDDDSADRQRTFEDAQEAFQPLRRGASA